MYQKTVLFKRNETAYLAEIEEDKIIKFDATSKIDVTGLDSKKMYVVFIESDEDKKETKIYVVQDFAIKDTNQDIVRTEDLPTDTLFQIGESSLKSFSKNIVYH